MRRSIGLVAVTLIVSLAAKPCLADDDHAATHIRPEMTVHFKDGALACVNQEDLLKITLHAINGESTKAAAMMIDRGGDCFMLSPAQRVKVISVQYNDPSLDFGLLETVGENVTRLSGAWAYSIGAEQVQIKDRLKKHRHAGEQ